MSDPLTLGDAAALKIQGDLGRFIKQQMAQARYAATHRRALVLRHRDLADALTQPPINFSAPDKWNGYIPPATDCTGAINTTPCRPALLAIVAEAEARATRPQEEQAA